MQALIQTLLQTLTQTHDPALIGKLTQSSNKSVRQNILTMSPDVSCAMFTLLPVAVVWPAMADLRRVLLCRRMAEACRQLGLLTMKAEEDACQAAVNGLLEANRTRTISFYVPSR